MFTLSNGDTIQNINIDAGNNQIIGSGVAGFTLSGVNQTAANASAISLTNATGTITMTGGGISGAAGPSFFVSGGSATTSYSGTIANTAGHSVQVQGITGGSVTLSGAITDTGAGILVQNNIGGTVTFSGASDSIHAGANQAVTLTSNTGATVNFTGGGPLDPDHLCDGLYRDRRRDGRRVGSREHDFLGRGRRAQSERGDERGHRLRERDGQPGHGNDRNQPDQRHG